MYRKVLIPTDGESHSEAAVRVALEFSKSLGASAIVTTVYQPVGPLDSTDLYNAYLLEKARHTLSNWEQWAKQYGVKLETRLLEDENIAPALVELAKQTACDLIAMGTHGREGIGRLVLGSVAERVVRLATLPVMLLRFDAIAPTGVFPKRILVPLDGGPASELALLHATQIAKATGAGLELVHIVPDILPMFEGLTWRMYDAASAEEVNQRFALEGQAILEKAKAKIGGLTFNTTLRHTQGERIAQAILQVGLEVGADLICMGTHGYVGFERLLLGSVAEGVAHHARVPVLLLRPNPSEQASSVGSTAQTAMSDEIKSHGNF